MADVRFTGAGHLYQVEAAGGLLCTVFADLAAARFAVGDAVHVGISPPPAFASGEASSKIARS